ncbi:DMT family transporter [Parabacteroides sp. OttesenSCG-928-G07]|nr:DMT family transporter [Parabacteroides sp. OttesenSCG-928-G07]
MEKAKVKGHLAVLFANVIFGLNVPITKSLLTGWMTPMGYTTTRMLFGAFIFWLIGLFAPKEKVEVKDLLIIAAGGLFGLIVPQYTFALGLQYTSPVNFSLIVALGPIAVMLLAALFLKEPITMKKALGVLLGISGALVIVFQNRSFGSGPNDMLGILLALVNITNYGIYLIIIRKISSKYSPVTLMKWMFFFTVVFILPFGYADLFTQQIYASGVPWTAYLQFAFILIFSTAVAYFLIPVSLKTLRPTTVSVYMNLQPIIASTVAILVGQDVFSWDKPLAVALVIAGVIVVTQSKSREDVEKEGAA